MLRMSTRFGGADWQAASGKLPWPFLFPPPTPLLGPFSDVGEVSYVGVPSAMKFRQKIGNFVNGRGPVRHRSWRGPRDVASHPRLFSVGWRLFQEPQVLPRWRGGRSAPLLSRPALCSKPAGIDDPRLGRDETANLLAPSNPAAAGQSWVSHGRSKTL